MAYIPSHNTQAIFYSRYYKEGKVLRVARIDPCKGLCLALYPTNDSDIFSTEACEKVDDHSAKGTIARGDIPDQVWLKLLDGVSQEEITKDYEPDGRETFSYCPKGTPFNKTLRSRSFRIGNDKNEEDILEESKRLESRPQTA